MPTTSNLPQATPEALAFYRDAEQMMTNLASRWLDEYQHEDIADYMAPLQPLAERCGVELLKMTKRPFGVRYRVGAKEFHAKVTSRVYQYTRTK